MEQVVNRSGIRPMEYKVLILPEKVEEKTAGGIILAPQTMEKEKFSKAKGMVIAFGPIAFTDPNWLDHPKVGDVVLYDKYAGSLVTGTDDVEYRMINDKEIGAVIEVAA